MSLLITFQGNLFLRIVKMNMLRCTLNHLLDIHVNTTIWDRINVDSVIQFAFVGTFLSTLHSFIFSRNLFRHNRILFFDHYQ